MGGDWLISQYAKQNNESLKKQVSSEIEHNSELGRLLAAEKWDFKFIAGSQDKCFFCGSKHTDSYSSKPLPRDPDGEAKNQSDVYQCGYCHDCKRVFLVHHDIVIRNVRGPQPQRNANGDICGSLADFYFRDRE